MLSYYICVCVVLVFLYSNHIIVNRIQDGSFILRSITTLHHFYNFLCSYYTVYVDVHSLSVHMDNKIEVHTKWKTIIFKISSKE